MTIEITDEMKAAFRAAQSRRADELVAEGAPLGAHDILDRGLAAVLAIVVRDIPVARTQIQHKDRERFATSAAPEAIAVYLRRARIAQRAAQREVEWLSALLERRTAERDAGAWP